MSDDQRKHLELIQTVIARLEQGVFSGGGALLLVAPQQGSYESSPLRRLPADEIDEPAFR